MTIVSGVPAHRWESVAALTAALFYVNRVLQTSEVWYGYVAAALAALVTGFEANDEQRGRVWTAMALLPFGLGWWRRQFDFRVQGYGLALYRCDRHRRLFPAAGAFAGGRRGGRLRVRARHPVERRGPLRRAASATALRVIGACVTAVALCALVWRLVPGDYLGIAWLALGVAMLEAGLRAWPEEFFPLAMAVALLGADARRGLRPLEQAGAGFRRAHVRLRTARARAARAGRVLDAAIWPGTLFLLAGLLALLPAQAVSPAWALAALAFAEFERRSPRGVAMMAGAVVLARCLAIDLEGVRPTLTIAPAIAIFWAAMLRRPTGSLLRLYHSLLATVLLGALIFHEVSGSMLTMAWGAEAIALLAAGFALRDRVLRLSGLALFLVCTLKLFFWDLRNLETLPRIMSFIVLGLLLVAVSWVYTRFRDQVQKFL